MKLIVALLLSVLGVVLFVYGWFRYQSSTAAAATEIIVTGHVVSFENRQVVRRDDGKTYKIRVSQLWWIIEYQLPDSSIPHTLAVASTQLRHLDKVEPGTHLDIAVNPLVPEQAHPHDPEGDRVIYLSLFGMGGLLWLFALLAWRA